MHTPAKHSSSISQELPHFPQLDSSKSRKDSQPSDAVLLQSPKFGVHEATPHALDAQYAVAFGREHARPQSPQFAGSFFVSTQSLPHLVEPPTQVRAHTPAWQTSPLAQAVLQLPQLAGSFFVLRH